MNTICRAISDEQLLDEVYSDPVVIMDDLFQAFARAEHLLKDERVVRFNRKALENMVMKLTEGITR